MADAIEVETSATIPTSADRIWDVLCDLRRLPDWGEFGELVESSSTLAALGVTYTTRGAEPWTAHWEVVEFAAPHRQAHAGRVRFMKDVLSTIELAPVSGATEVTATFRFRPGLGPLGALLRRGMERRALARSERSLVRLAGMFTRQTGP